MKILHYALGFPPYRSGGLTKFCIDLMSRQVQEGHMVAMVWPGQMGFISRGTKIKEREEVRFGNKSVGSFEIINPLPISYDEGIADIESFTADAGYECYSELLNDFAPDVVHVHTLMGLHKSLLETAKNKSIRLVFTAHDFFPICPKVTMFRQDAVCDSLQTCEKCGTCNATALSLKKIQILQSPIYRKLKDSALVKTMRKKHRDSYLSEVTSDDLLTPVGRVEDYRTLRSYYYSLLKLMDEIHYNSSVTKMVYERFFELPQNCTISITHADIGDHRTTKSFSHGKLRIRYLGPNGGAKGFFSSRRHWINCGMIGRIFV